MQKIVKFVTGVDYAQKNIEKAFTVLKANSDGFTHWQKNSPSNKGKEHGQAQQKVQSLKPSISTSKPHVENLNKSRE